MAIEIIKSGHVSRQYTATCRCGCEFRFHAKDAKACWDQRDGNYFEIRCPECNTHVYKQQEQGYQGPG